MPLAPRKSPSNQVKIPKALKWDYEPKWADLARAGIFPLECIRTYSSRNPSRTKPSIHFPDPFGGRSHWARSIHLGESVFNTAAVAMITPTKETVTPIVCQENGKISRSEILTPKTVTATPSNPSAVLLSEPTLARMNPWHLSLAKRLSPNVFLVSTFRTRLGDGTAGQLPFRVCYLSSNQALKRACSVRGTRFCQWHRKEAWKGTRCSY